MSKTVMVGVGVVAAVVIMAIGLPQIGNAQTQTNSDAFNNWLRAYGNASTIGPTNIDNSSNSSSSILTKPIMTETPQGRPVNFNPGISIHKDSIGYAHLTGEIQNNGDSPVTFAKIIVTVYDANNGVVGTAFTYTDPTTVPAHSTSPFDLMISPDNMQG